MTNNNIQIAKLSTTIKSKMGIAWITLYWSTLITILFLLIYGAVAGFNYFYGLQSANQKLPDLIQKVTQVKQLKPSERKTEFLNIVENSVNDEYLSLSEYNKIESMHDSIMVWVKIDESKTLLQD